MVGQAVWRASNISFFSDNLRGGGGRQGGHKGGGWRGRRGMGKEMGKGRQGRGVADEGQEEKDFTDGYDGIPG